MSYSATPVFIIALLLELASVILGAFIARSKNRSWWAGALLGLFLGLLGVAIVALLSKVPDAPPPTSVEAGEPPPEAVSGA